MVNDKNRLYSNFDVIKDMKEISKRRTSQPFSRFSVASSTAINVAGSTQQPQAEQINFKPYIGNPADTSYGTIGATTQPIFFDQYGSNYNSMTINGDVTFEFTKLQQGWTIIFTIDFIIDTGTPPTLIWPSTILNLPTLPTLSDTTRVVMTFVGVSDENEERYTYIGGTIASGGTGSLPAGTVDNQHLEWDATTVAWLAATNMKFGIDDAIDPHAASGFLRYKNAATILAARDVGDTGDIALSINATDVVDWTAPQGTTAKWQLRAQHSVNPDAAFQIQQVPNDGTTTYDTILDSPADMWLYRAGSPKVLINAGYASAFQGHINLNGNRIDLLSDLVYTAFSGSGKAINFNALGLDYLVENIAHSHRFFAGGTGPTNSVLDIKVSEIELLNSSNINMGAGDITALDDIFFNVTNHSILSDGLGIQILADTGDSVVLGTAGTPRIFATDTQVEIVNSNLDVNANAIILDANGDSKIQAGTDDVIQINTGGFLRISISDASTVFLNTLTPAGDIDMNSADILNIDNAVWVKDDTLPATTLNYIAATATTPEFIFHASDAISFEIGATTNILKISTTVINAHLPIDMETNDVFNIDSVVFQSGNGTLGSLDVGFSSVVGGGFRGNVLTTTGSFAIARENVTKIEYAAATNNLIVSDTALFIHNLASGKSMTLSKGAGTTGGFISDIDKLTIQAAGAGQFEITDGNITFFGTKGVIANVNQIGFINLGNLIEDDAFGLLSTVIAGQQHRFNDSDAVVDFLNLHIDHADWGASTAGYYHEMFSRANPGVTGLANKGRIYFDSNNSHHLTVVRNSTSIDLEDSGAVSPLTTKGDLYTFSSVDARLPVGITNGFLLSVDSAEVTGLKWITPPGDMLLASAQTVTGVKSFNNATLFLKGATTNGVTVSATDGFLGTVTLPGITGTLMSLAGSQTVTGLKTFDGTSTVLDVTGIGAFINVREHPIEFADMAESAVGTVGTGERRLFGNTDNGNKLSVKRPDGEFIEVEGHRGPMGNVPTGTTYVNLQPMQDGTSATIAGDTMYAIPWVPAEDCTVDGCGWYVITAGVNGTGTTVDGVVGIYSNDPSAGNYPDQLLTQNGSSTAQITSATTITSTFSSVEHLKGGTLYWVVFWQDLGSGAGGVQPVLPEYDGSVMPNVVGLDAGTQFDISTNDPFYGYSVVLATGFPTFPSTFTAGATKRGFTFDMPAVFISVSSTP